MPDSSHLSTLLQNKPLRAATILSVLLQVKVSPTFIIRRRSSSSSPISDLRKTF